MIRTTTTIDNTIIHQMARGLSFMIGSLGRYWLS